MRADCGICRHGGQYEALDAERVPQIREPGPANK